VSELLYLTADAVGAPTGGGVVTANEVAALKALGNVTVWSFPDAPRPWGADEAAFARLRSGSWCPTLAHVYSGTFSKTVQILKERGCKVTYTCAAHDRAVSRREHELLDLPFDYPHLTDPEQWRRYSNGYFTADRVVTPSNQSAQLMRSYGCKNVVVIPHGIDLPVTVRPLPQRFAVAYLGQAGPDKGLRYLLEAWKILGYADVMLTIAGRGTEHLLPLARQIAGGSVFIRGAVDDVSEIYDACALYVQPSATEGFGIEVLEAMARGRVVLCSYGAGASDVLPAEQVVAARNADALARAIERFRGEFEWRRSAYEARGDAAARDVQAFWWPDIYEQYRSMWAIL
jgi:glycosyltransferase involved in cell wall biosynthesis